MPGPLHAADARQAVAAMGDQCVDERARACPAAGCTTSPAGLSITTSRRPRRRRRDRWLPLAARPPPRRHRRARAACRGPTFRLGSSATTPLTDIRPSRMSACSRDRERSGHSRAVTRSRRSGPGDRLPASILSAPRRSRWPRSCSAPALAPRRLFWRKGLWGSTRLVIRAASTLLAPFV